MVGQAAARATRFKFCTAKCEMRCFCLIERARNLAETQSQYTQLCSVYSVQSPVLSDSATP